MQFIVEFKSFYKEGDVVLIHYWYNDMVTPVKIVEKVSTKKFKVSHNTPGSKIQNAPDEILSSSDFIDKYRLKDEAQVDKLI